MTKQSTPWTFIVAVIAFISAAASFLGNLGGARNAVCSLPAITPFCIHAGLIAAPADPRAARQALLHRVEGVWGNPFKDGAPACATTLRYSLAARGDESFIILRTGDGSGPVGIELGFIAAHARDQLVGITLGP